MFQFYTLFKKCLLIEQFKKRWSYTCTSVNFNTCNYCFRLTGHNSHLNIFSAWLLWWKSISMPLLVFGSQPTLVFWWIRVLYNPLEYKGLNHYSHSSHTYITMVRVKCTLHLIDNFFETYTSAFYFFHGNMQSKLRQHLTNIQLLAL